MKKKAKKGHLYGLIDQETNQLVCGAVTEVFSSCHATYRLHQNGRVPYGCKGSSIYYGTRPYRCNKGSV